MAINVDDEILQDFLVEAGEILESLSEQLIELEHRPTDKDLLNSVFRGFHTVKGGAGFLGVTALVDICHRAEDVFNILRQGERTIDAALMDVVLKVVDIVNNMMRLICSGEEPKPVDAALLTTLEAFAKPASAPAPVAAVSEKINPQEPTLDEIDREFEELLNKMAPQGQTAQTADKGRSPAASEPAVSDADKKEISEEEFESLLDQLHGKGKSIGPSAAILPASPQPVAVHQSHVPESSATDSAAPIPERRNDKKPLAAAAVPAVEDTAEVAAKPPAKEASQQQIDPTVRVDTKRLDDIMNLVGELVLVRNRLATLKASMDNEEVSQAVGNLDVVTSDLQSAVMKTRMQPIKKVFGRFPRVVRDLSRTLNKEINLELIGEETDLDKNLVEALADPLVHLVRNSIDHGVEEPAVRAALGKNRVGTIVLSARQEGDHIVLSIKDDGAGMSADRLRRKALEKGLIEEETAARLDDKDCYNLIFLPGFSTKNEISDVSGRGVGMDVVKTRITQLNGSLEIDSEEGKGTEITIKLPLTLAIVPTLMVMLGRQIFAIPLANVREIIQMDSVKTNVVEGRAVAIIRDHPLPLFHLGRWLVRAGWTEQGSPNSYIVVVKFGTSQIACIVDHLMTQEEVVIKPLGALLQGIPGLAGATITGDGRIALILDMPGLMAAYAGKR